MSQSQTPSEYTVSDHTAVDEQIKQMTAREAEQTRHLRYTNHMKLASVLGIVLVALGLFLLLAGWGLKLARSYKTEEIHHTIVENREFPAEIGEVDNASPLPPDTTFDPELRQLINDGKVMVKKDVTYFVTRETGRDDFSVVTTGLNYKTSSDTKPYWRFCYASQPFPDGTSKRVELGWQMGDARAEKHERPAISGLTPTLFDNLYSLCAWNANAENLTQ